MLRDTGVRRVTDAKIDKVCYFLSHSDQEWDFWNVRKVIRLFLAKNVKNQMAQVHRELTNYMP